MAENENKGPVWGPTNVPLNGFVLPPPFPPMYASFNLTSYLQGASDYEVMCNLLYVVRALQEEFNKLKEYVEGLEDEIRADMQKELEKFQAQLDAQIQRLEQALQDYDKRFNDLEQEQKDKFDQLSKDVAQQITDALAEMRNAINDLKAEQDRNLAELKAKVDAELNKVNQTILQFQTYVDNRDEYYWELTLKKLQELDDKIEKNYASTWVFNIFRGTGTPLENYFRDWYNFTRDGGISAEMQEMSGYTADQLDAKRMTAAQYDFEGALPGRMDAYRVFNPVDGQWSNVFYAVQSLSDFHRTSAETATDYDDAGLDAEAYDELELTAYRYDYGGIAG